MFQSELISSLHINSLINADIYADKAQVEGPSMNEEIPNETVMLLLRVLVKTQL